TAAGVRTTLASSNYTLNVTNQTLSLTSTWFNANKSSYQKVVVSYETVQPVLNASGKPTLIDGQVAVFKTLFQQKYLQNDNGQYIDANGQVTANPVLATRTYFNLTGLGLGSGLGRDGNQFNGVEYLNMEAIELRLNKTSADTFTIDKTHAGETTLVLGGGADVVSVKSLS